MTRAPSTEEPCAAKVSSTVLKTSGRGDPLAEFNSQRNKKAAKKFFKKLLKGLHYVPRVLITCRSRISITPKSP